MNPLDRLCRSGLNPDAELPFLGFSLTPAIVEHHHFKKVVGRIARLHRRGLSTATSGGFLLTAQSGIGKSRLLEYYKDHFPRTVVNGCTKIPVLYVETPQGPSTLTLASAILEALGDPFAYKGNQSERTSRVIRFFQSSQLELLLIDEFQNFYEGNNRNEREDVSNWLKGLLNKSKVPVVLSGMPRSIHVLGANKELRRRFGTAHYYPPFSIDSRADMAAFRAVLKALHQQLPIPCPPLHDADLARRFYYATNGVIDYVVRILETAVKSQTSREAARIDSDVLFAAFEEEVSSVLPDELNPFHPDAVLRPLTGKGEPFGDWDDPVKLGLIKPRRNRKSPRDTELEASESDCRLNRAGQAESVSHAGRH